MVKPVQLDNSELSEIPDDSDYYDRFQYVPTVLPAGKTLIIPVDHQMIRCNEYIIDGELVIDGELCI